MFLSYSNNLKMLNYTLTFGKSSLIKALIRSMNFESQKAV